MSRSQRRPRGAEATQQEMILFQNLLKSGNEAAQAALAAFNSSEDKDAFQQQIIEICASHNANPASSPSASKSLPAPAREPVKTTKSVAASSEPVKVSSGTSRPCSFFARSGHCRKGDKCNFAHIKSETTDAAPTKPATRPSPTETAKPAAAKATTERKSGAKGEARTIKTPRAASKAAPRAPEEAPAPSSSQSAADVDTISITTLATGVDFVVQAPSAAEVSLARKDEATNPSLSSPAAVSHVSVESLQHSRTNIPGNNVLELLGLPSDQDARLHDLLDSVGSLSLGFDGFSAGRPPSIPPVTASSPDINVIRSPKKSPEKPHPTNQTPQGQPQGPPQGYPQGPPQGYPQGPPQGYPQGPAPPGMQDIPHPSFPMDMYGMYPPPMPYPPMPYPPPYYWPHAPPPMYPYPYMPPFGPYGPPPPPQQQEQGGAPEEDTVIEVPRTPQAPISPPRPQPTEHQSAPAPPPPDTSATSKLLSMLHSAEPTSETPAPAKTEKHIPKKHRVTKNQPGRIAILSGRDSAPVSGLHVSPGDSMTVRWELPSEVFAEHRAHLVVSLSRYGSSTNTQNVVEKSLKNAKLTRNDDTVSGDIFFHAPKASGYFCYRIYSQRDEDSKFVTLATSPCYVVDLRGRDVTSNLKFAYEILKKRQVEMNGCMSLKTTVEFMCGTGQVLQKDDPQFLLQKCVQFLFDILTTAIETLNKRRTLLASETTSGENNDDLWSSIHMAQRVNIGVHETLTALLQNASARSLLSEDLGQRVVHTLSCYCPILHRFFSSKDDMVADRFAELHFRPAELQQYSSDPQFVSAFTQCIESKLPKLLPSADFYPRRYEARQRLQRILVEAGAIPPTTELAIFGSSMNNFGADTADLDMCLVYYPENSIPVSDRGAVIDRLGEALENAGMHNVIARGTARIPIVMFDDPVSGLQCDISFNNPLALRNTTLLATYSAIDPRVRELAFTVKHWVKRRHMNSPLDGTLGSYGYLLMLIHFLQTRSPPVLPYLQKLPPSWPQPGKSIPHRWEKHPVENCYCDTYFYDGDMTSLQSYAARNTQSTGELFAEFVRYVAWECDFAKQVISVRQPTPMLKTDKAEADCWPMHNRLCVEDPFETWYDVAHVLKNTQMDYLRKEFVRAFTILCNATFKPVSDDKNLIYCVSEAFDKICETAELPEFTRSLKEATSRSRANTVGSELGGTV